MLLLMLQQDTELGVDPVCWKSRSYNANDQTHTSDDEEEEVLSFPSDLIENYKIAGQVQLLQSCPSKLNMTVQLPPEFQYTDSSLRPRTNTYYEFKVQATIDLSTLDAGAQYFVSDEGPRVMVQIILCRLGSVGFCSPFVSLRESK